MSSLPPQSYNHRCTCVFVCVRMSACACVHVSVNVCVLGVGCWGGIEHFDIFF